MKNIKKLANQKYIEFSNFDGSQHIATEHAIYRILENIKINKTRSILEIGLGIGTIFSSVFDYDNTIKYYGTENNDFCLNSLRENLNQSYNSLNILKEIKFIQNEKFDLIIIDGKDESLVDLESLVKRNSIIIIEGDRKDQEYKLKKIFPKHKFVHIISINKNNSKGVFSSEYYQGGIKILFINPTLNQFIYYIKHKWLTFFKYKIRKIRY